jgi:hypothetical protein
VNIVCDHCLLIGYADQQRKIDREIVEQAIDYLEEGEPPRRRLVSGLRWLLLPVAAALVAGTSLWALRPDQFTQLVNLLSDHLQDLSRLAHGLLGRLSLAFWGSYP